MHIGFFFEDIGLDHIDLSNPEKGNPGIGGTQYLFLLLAYNLNKKYNYKITFINYTNAKLPENIEKYRIVNENECLEICDKLKIDFFIYHAGKNKEWYERCRLSSVKLIAWAHNYISYKEAQLINSINSIKRLVFVGKQEYDRYFDHDVIKKSKYIFNQVDFIEEKRQEKSKNIVTYMGSLTYPKGFHWLASIWKDVLVEVPNAELHVIGGGNLYNRNNISSTYGIAAQEYENIFMPDLLDDNGDILNSVHFHGTMGVEKVDILKETAVGVMNPSGLTETFGLSAVEMESCGIPVVSRKKYGLLDTVLDKSTGLLISNKKDLKDALITLLKNKELNESLGNNAYTFVRKKFNNDIILAEWNKLLLDINNQIPAKVCFPNDYYLIDFKWLRILNHILRFKFKLYILPSIGEIFELIRSKYIRK